MPTFNPTDWEDDNLYNDPRYYTPDGTAWCRFGKGLFCINGGQCKNPNHKEYSPDDIDQV